MNPCVRIVTALVLLFMCIAACGSDNEETTRVSLQLVQEESKGAIPLYEKYIPSDVTSVTVSISASDMEPIEKTVSVTSDMRRDGYILLEFEVPNGTERGIFVEAYDVEGYPMYSGHAHVDLTGGATEVRIYMSTSPLP